MTLRSSLQAEGFASDALSASVEAILQSTRLLSLATVTEDGRPWIHNAYFAYDSHFHLYCLTQPTTVHSKNLMNTDGHVAISVTDSQQTGDGGKRGLQLQGKCELASASLLTEGLECYRARFAEFRDVLQSMDSLLTAGWQTRLYVTSVTNFKLFDETTFGAEVWINGRVV